MTIPILQSINRTIPYYLVPSHDESVSSWMARLARKHYCSVHDFFVHYGISKLLKSDVDLLSDLSGLKCILPEDAKIPNQLIQKIPNFQWTNGRSDWLIAPNKSGSIQFNSFTKLCISCLRKKGYYQLKWKLELIEGCTECNCYLIEKCPKCKNFISPIKSDFRFPVNLNINPIFCCWFCEFDFRKARVKKMEESELEGMIKINRAYEEDPTNMRFLESLKNRSTSNI